MMAGLPSGFEATAHSIVEHRRCFYDSVVRSEQSLRLACALVASAVPEGQSPRGTVSGWSIESSSWSVVASNAPTCVCVCVLLITRWIALEAFDHGGASVRTRGWLIGTAELLMSQRLRVHHAAMIERCLHTEMLTHRAPDSLDELLLLLLLLLLQSRSSTSRSSSPFEWRSLSQTSSSTLPREALEVGTHCEYDEAMVSSRDCCV